MRYLLAVVLFLVSSLAIADGLRFEAAIGKTSFGNAGDNMWFDQTYPHDNHLTTSAWEIGVSGDFTQHLGWRVSAIDFGKPSNWGVWPDDDLYLSGHAHYPQDKPIARGEGSGRAYGVTLAPILNFRPFRDSQIGIEAGGLVYHASWGEQWALMDGNGNTSSQWYTVTTGANGHHTDGITPYAGVSFRYKYAFVSYRRYRNIWATDAVFGNHTKQLMAGISLPF